MSLRCTLSAAIAVASGAACLVAVVAWPASYRRAGAVAAFGPGGRPAVVAAASGSFHVLLSDVNTGPLMAWTVTARGGSRRTFEERRDAIVLSADRRMGDTVVQPTAAAAGTAVVATVRHGRIGLTAGRGPRSARATGGPGSPTRRCRRGWSCRR